MLKPILRVPGPQEVPGGLGRGGLGGGRPAPPGGPAPELAKDGMPWASAEWRKPFKFIRSFVELSGPERRTALESGATHRASGRGRGAQGTGNPLA